MDKMTISLEMLKKLILKESHYARFGCVGSTNPNDYEINLENLFKILERYKYV